MSVELVMWNPADPERKQTVERPDAQSAAMMLSGAIQAAIDFGGTLMVEIKEKT